MTKVLIIASGHSAFEYFDYPYKENGWKIVVVSNAWKLTEDWEYCIHSCDIKEKPPNIKNKITTKEYIPSLNKYGGHKQCGHSIVLAASYYILDHFKPSVIGYLGCDMNYTPNENGHTHFYGIGYDISDKNISDPDHMIKLYGNDDPEYLTNIYNRFAQIAKENNCDVYNFSSEINTRLPHKKKTPKEIDAS